MVLQNYQNFIEITSNMIYTVAFGGGLKCPCKIHLNTQWGWGTPGGGVQTDHFGRNRVQRIVRPENMSETIAKPSK
jgi:hypothetical protein